MKRIRRPGLAPTSTRRDRTTACLSARLSHRTGRPPDGRPRTTSRQATCSRPTRATTCTRSASAITSTRPRRTATVSASGPLPRLQPYVRRSRIIANAPTLLDIEFSLERHGRWPTARRTSATPISSLFRQARFLRQVRERAFGSPFPTQPSSAGQVRPGLERDVASFHDEPRPSFGVQPGTADSIDLSLRDPTGLGATLSDMDSDLVVACEIQHLREWRHAFAMYGTGNPGADQVCRISGENHPNLDAGLLGSASKMKWDGRLRRVGCSPRCRDRQDRFHAAPPGRLDRFPILTLFDPRRIPRFIARDAAGGHRALKLY